MKELPKSIRRNIFKDFLFSDFIFNFRQFFAIPKKIEGKKTITYSWEDDKFQSFMIKVLQSLEPRFVTNKEYIYRENEDVEEIFFVMSGEYVIGYTV
mmetsp:Transcript_35740/g.26547  ORF Transcript_35740/g.26547 Transcript_35740/m.26547 type:complete len:97 (-) Transcript_35740:490-780(-)